MWLKLILRRGTWRSDLYCGWTLDASQGLKIAAHIFASEAGDYYEIDAGVPVSLGGDHNVALP